MQLTLGFPAAPPSLERADFIAAASNDAALAWLENWREWPMGRLCLFGPPGSGRSHLAAVFAGAAQACWIDPQALTETALPDLLPDNACVVLDDCDRFASERALLHLLNLAAEAGGSVLMTARTPPARWPVALPDLHSRLAAAPAVPLGIPDATLLRAVLAKAAADRQLALPPALLDWLGLRLPRDLAAATRAIAALDRRILLHQRRPGLADAEAALLEAALLESAARATAGDDITMTALNAPSRQAPALL